CCRRRHRHETSDLHASTATNGRSASECHAKWPDRPSNAMQKPAMPEVALISGWGLLGSPENRYKLPTSEFIRGIAVQLSLLSPDKHQALSLMVCRLSP